MKRVKREKLTSVIVMECSDGPGGDVCGQRDCCGRAYGGTASPRSAAKLIIIQHFLDSAANRSSSLCAIWWCLIHLLRVLCAQFLSMSLDSFEISIGISPRLKYVYELLGHLWRICVGGNWKSQLSQRKPVRFSDDITTTSKSLQQLSLNSSMTAFFVIIYR